MPSERVTGPMNANGPVPATEAHVFRELPTSYTGGSATLEPLARASFNTCCTTCSRMVALVPNAVELCSCVVISEICNRAAVCCDDDDERNGCIS